MTLLKNKWRKALVNIFMCFFFLPNYFSFRTQPFGETFEATWSQTIFRNNLIPSALAFAHKLRSSSQLVIGLHSISPPPPLTSLAIETCKIENSVSTNDFAFSEKREIFTVEMSDHRNIFTMPSPFFIFPQDIGQITSEEGKVHKFCSRFCK